MNIGRTDVYETQKLTQNMDFGRKLINKLNIVFYRLLDRAKSKLAKMLRDNKYFQNTKYIFKSK